MDIATSLGLIGGAIVLCTLIMMGGDLRMFADAHAAIIIFGGSFAATLIRFPLSSIFHGLPLGAKFAFTLRRITQRDLVDEIAKLAEIARKQGPLGLEKVKSEDPFLAKGIRFVADGYDSNFIRDNLERDRDNFLTHLDEGQKIYRAVGDCAPAFGMIPAPRLGSMLASPITNRTTAMSAIGLTPIVLRCRIAVIAPAPSPSWIAGESVACPGA